MSQLGNNLKFLVEVFIYNNLVIINKRYYFRDLGVNGKFIVIFKFCSYFLQVYLNIGNYSYFIEKNLNKMEINGF